MLRTYAIAFLSLLLIILCGCQHSKDQAESSYIPVDEEETSSITLIEMNGKSFSLEEMNSQIENTFNNVLYLHGTILWLGDILNQNVKYDLYYEPNSKSGPEAFVNAPKIYLIIASPQINQKENKELVIGIDVTEWGLRSGFSYQGLISLDQTDDFVEGMDFLGSFSMHIDKIIPPKYQTVDSDWQKKMKNAIQLYMDDENLNQGLPEGNYTVYVQKFFESDKDSSILFEHENGDIYIGDYYFIHEVSGENPADLNKVELYEYSDESFKKYVEKVRLDPAVSLEYCIERQKK